MEKTTITKDDGFDIEGNPKLSVEIKVPCVEIGTKPGENG
jgi:hypothetical protein